ncbi:hypothetical protein GLOIN_2v1828645 [Rhizophagus irregularis DAOM 181602=DAOM 197198]|nr:hypothetical protein GLOIN_2v1828645 [Rhizophagus irregularis DAOM 181602=DAOM 197198]
MGNNTISIDNMPLEAISFPSLQKISTKSTFHNEYSFLISVKKFHVNNNTRTGYNKIYEFRRSKSYFFELANQFSGTNDIHLIIHTNDYNMQTKPTQYISTSPFPNKKFQISKMLTHFFSLQRVIPRRIQQRYFNLIRHKLLDRFNIIRSRVGSTLLPDNEDHPHLGSQHNKSSKTFFNFSYKRYRFRFGCYIPCRCLMTLNKSKDISFCHVPSPFVMTNDRHACVDHQKEFFRNRLFHFIKHDSPRDQVLSNNKTSHATQLYNRWKEGTEKEIFSRRLGIEFSMKYLAASNKNIIRYNHRYMYMKRLFNFKFIHSPNPNIKKKQQKRFNRSCNRVFNTRYDSSCISFEEKLKAAQANHFIFHKHQTIHKNLSHLTYSKKSAISDANSYPFNIPFYELIIGPSAPKEDLLLDEPALVFSGVFKVDLPANTPSLNLNSSGTSMNNFNFNNSIDNLTSKDIFTFSPHPAHTMVPTVENYNPFRKSLGDRFKPFVPRSPIYDHFGHYLPPESDGWLQVVKKSYASRNKPDPVVELQQWQASKKKKNRLKPKEYQCRLDEAIRQSTLHIYHGTSAKHVKRLLATTTHLTTLQTTYHRYMSYATSDCSERIYQHELKRFQYYLDAPPKNYMLPHLEDIAYNDTSDDTKCLEVRPKKRDTLTNLCDRYLHRDRIKHIRLDTGYPIDSPVSSLNKS